MSEKEKECMSKGRSILHFFLPKFDILKIIRIIGSFISFCSLPWEFSGYLREKIMRKRLNCFRLTQVFSRMITFIVIGICTYFCLTLTAIVWERKLFLFVSRIHLLLKKKKSPHAKTLSLIRIAINEHINWVFPGFNLYCLNHIIRSVLYKELNFYGVTLYSLTSSPRANPPMYPSFFFQLYFVSVLFSHAFL